MLNLSIKMKIISSVVISLLVLAIVLGSLAVISSKNALMKKSYDSLTSARESKVKQINTFFNEKLSDIKILKQSSNIINFNKELSSIYNTLDINKNAAFPVEDNITKKITKKYDLFFQNYAKEYGYYDIFIINAEHGHVMYSQARESDYGANLINGSLKTSSLNAVYKKVIENKREVFVDMKPYAPSNGAPALFLGTPIYEDNKINSVLVFQISDRAINSIMNFRKGYGQSQEDYLVGPDKLMRSDSFLDQKNHSLKASFSNPTLGSVNTQGVEEAFSGKSETKIIIDYNNNPVLSAYTTLSIGEDFKWALLSEIDEAEVLIEPNSLRNTIIIGAIIILALIILVILFLINQTLVKPLQQFQMGLLDFFKYLNREIDTVKALDNKSVDEIGLMSKIVNENINITKDSIEEDRKFIDETISVLNEFEQGDMGQRLNSSASNPSLMKLKTVLNKMGENMEKNITNVLKILEEYASYNYLNKIDESSLQKHLLQLAQGVNKLGISTTEMLNENKTNGTTLEDSSTTLLQNVEVLNDSSNQAAASLEETAAALEEITATIVNNTETISDMSKYATQLNSSTKQGQELANKTMNAMEDINDQVSEINNAITVIDQIAFQTNILSLNAAVEAATAGEAGKGFAVVAQEVRNLASRSAQAAKEIKEIVENANTKAVEGKTISSSMINGYASLNDNIAKTIELINNVENSSKEQQSGIEQINDAITSQDRQTQQIAQAASQTNEIAKNTSNVAAEILRNVNEKKFNENTNNIKNKSNVKDKKVREKNLDLDFKKNEKRTLEKSIKKGSNNDSGFEDKTGKEEWESF